MIYDVAIIGAGVTGAFITRELSRYRVSICLLEKEADVGMGTSKANSAIVHAGFDVSPGTLKARLNVRGNELMGQMAKELDVHFKRIGSLVLCFDESDIPKLYELEKKGLRNGVEGLEVVFGEKLRQMEPNVSENVIAALYAPSAGIICPYELTLNAVENAVENGVDLKLEYKVTEIRYEDGLFHLSTTAGDIESRYLVNAAGVYSDEISRLVGDHSFSVNPRKGEYILYDKKYGALVNRVIFQLPSEKGKGVLVTPTVDGNLLIGPNAEEISDKEDVATTDSGQEQILKKARESVPALNARDIITSFAGLRAGSSRGDFIIESSQANSKLINAAGIESPGLTAAPAIGEMVVEILRTNGLRLVEKSDFNPIKKSTKKFHKMDENELNEMIKKDPNYGKIVCRCEKVTEGEIVDSIHRTVGAGDLDGVKRRTRVGMGRCQGGFCSCRVIEILAREIEIPMEKVTKSGGNSRLLAKKLK
jgi:glycerol-3-phosphate dehydrogenase